MIATASVGIFNRNIQPWHKIATTLTFTSNALLMIVLTNALHQTNSFASKIYENVTTFLVFLYFSLFGVAAFFFNVAYMTMVTDGMVARPHIWPIAVIEWGIFISMLAWVISIAIGLKPRVVNEKS